MSAPLRVGSEPATEFGARVERYLRELDPVVVGVQRDAACVYAEGVLAGIQIAIAALMRRERIIDHASRWEGHLRRVRARAGE
jgi:hypothetical protein